jgi:hypothetical protein
MLRRGVLAGFGEDIRRKASTSRCRELKGLNGEVSGHPGGQPAFQWMDPRDALALELKRHPGACAFVGSGAVDHQVAGSEDLRFVLVDGIGR